MTNYQEWHHGCKYAKKEQPQENNSKKLDLATEVSLTNYTKTIKELTSTSNKATCKTHKDLSSLLKIQKVSIHKTSNSSSSERTRGQSKSSTCKQYWRSPK